MTKFAATMIRYIDTHSHNSDIAFSDCEDEIIHKSLDAGVEIILEADIDSSEREKMYNLVHRYPKVLRPMLGLYPGSVKDNYQDELLLIESWYSNFHDEIVAMGEIGLDYHYGKEFSKQQIEAFIIQLELASKWNLAVNIHLREATEDFFQIISDYRHLGLRGNLHAFGGSYETFERISKFGDWYVGIGGVVTFKKSLIGQDIARIPIERVLLETDAPYLAPTPFRGQRNDSSYLPIIAEFIAERKGLSTEEVAEITYNNAKTLFSL